MKYFLMSLLISLSFASMAKESKGSAKSRGTPSDDSRPKKSKKSTEACTGYDCEGGSGRSNSDVERGDDSDDRGGGNFDGGGYDTGGGFASEISAILSNETQLTVKEKRNLCIEFCFADSEKPNWELKACVKNCEKIQE